MADRVSPPSFRRHRHDISWRSPPPEIGLLFRWIGSFAMTTRPADPCTSTAMKRGILSLLRSALYQCPVCGGAELIPDTRNLPYTYKGETTTIPAVMGKFCPAYGEVILEPGESDRVMREMKAFAKEVNAAVVDPVFTVLIPRSPCRPRAQGGAPEFPPPQINQGLHSVRVKRDTHMASIKWLLGVAILTPHHRRGQPSRGREFCERLHPARKDSRGVGGPSASGNAQARTRYAVMWWRKHRWVHRPATSFRQVSALRPSAAIWLRPAFLANKIVGQYAGIVHRGSASAGRAVIVDAATCAALGFAPARTGEGGLASSGDASEPLVVGRTRMRGAGAVDDSPQSLRPRIFDSPAPSGGSDVDRGR